MAAPKIVAKHCKICGDVLASDKVPCIHCRADDPVSQPQQPAKLLDLLESMGVKEVGGLFLYLPNPKSDRSSIQTQMPPKAAHRLLDWATPAARSEEVIGDLDERYFEVVLPRDGKKWANRWYWRQALGTVLPIWKRAIWNRIKGLGIVAGIGGALGWLWEKLSS